VSLHNLHLFWISLLSILVIYWSLFTLFFAGLQGLCEWRDIVARAEDESTGYVLPNKSVLEIGMKLMKILCILMLAIWLYAQNLICIYLFKS